MTGQGLNVLNRSGQSHDLRPCSYLLCGATMDVAVSEVLENESGDRLRVNVRCYAGSGAGNRERLCRVRRDDRRPRQRSRWLCPLPTPTLSLSQARRTVVACLGPPPERPPRGMPRSMVATWPSSHALSTAPACVTGSAIWDSIPTSLLPSIPASTAPPPSPAGPPKRSAEAWLVTACPSRHPQRAFPSIGTVSSCQADWLAPPPGAPLSLRPFEPGATPPCKGYVAPLWRPRAHRRETTTHHADPGLGGVGVGLGSLGGL